MPLRSELQTRHCVLPRISHSLVATHTAFVLTRTRGPRRVWTMPITELAEQLISKIVELRLWGPRAAYSVLLPMAFVSSEVDAAAIENVVRFGCHASSARARCFTSSRWPAQHALSTDTVYLVRSGGHGARERA